uniref:Putative unclassified retrotransposon protein n=1 Tax=Oryza sativa subsp. indica TaxID=39946 RepID=C5NNT5_ORYSI|nr:putative unclassified retrotransposon protein [Oryza sativa Indica Group]
MQEIRSLEVFGRVQV